MFRTMRRSGQEMPAERCAAILRRKTSGVLAVSGDGGYPYAVPLSYVYDGQRILFHSAVTGHKLDAVTADDKASFCVIDADEVRPEKFTTLYRSVIVFGRIRVLTDEADVREALQLFADKYSPAAADRGAAEIDGAIGRACILSLAIEQMTGKEAIEFIRERLK